MSLFLSRRAGGTARHLAWRTRLFSAGAVLGLVGIAADRRWLVNLAIGVLVVGFLLKFLPAGEKDPPTDASPRR